MNTNKIAPLKAGETLILSNGEYSDYSPIGLFKVLKDFEARAVMKGFSDVNSECKEGKYHIDRHSLLAAWLVTHGYLEELNYKGWNIGPYGTPNEGWFSDNPAREPVTRLGDYMDGDN